MAQLLSVNVGLPKDIAWNGKTVHTAIWKHSVAGKHRVRRLNIEGDKQGDLVGHGGEQRAVLVYQIESYHHWEREFGRHDFVYGQFGENLTVSDLPDDQVCIGDRYRIGTAVFEVTQPRVTCYRVGIRMGVPRMAALLVAHHRPGFYMRVIEEGEIEAGQAIIKVTDGPERLSVTDADALVYLPNRDRAQLERALRIDAFSPGWKAAFRSMAEGLHGTGWVENKGIILNAGTTAGWGGYHAMRVAAIRKETAKVLSLDLVPAAGMQAVAALPGQFVTLRLPAGAAGTPILRSYSLTDTSDPTRYPVCVQVEPDGRAGAWLRDHVHAGDAIEVAAPRGSFVLRDGTQPVVLLSAGLGVTPVLAMLRALVKSGSTREIWWCHGARNSSEQVFGAEVQRLLATLAHHRSVVAYSQPLPGDRVGVGFDVTGRLNLEQLRELGLPRDADFYLCGPESFMRERNNELAAWGIPADRIRVEHFGPGQSLMPGVVEQPTGPAHRPPGPEGTGPQISFVRSGLSVRWSDRYGSLLELAEACNVRVRFACRTGVCHTCINRLLEGKVKYAPEPLERPSADNALLCCSQPTGDVTIDI